MSTTATAHPPLTILSDDEELFRDSIAGFAAREVRPRVQQMEKDGKIDPALTRQYFDMGLMGLEVDEEHGGAGGCLMMVPLAVGEANKIPRAAPLPPGRQNPPPLPPIPTFPRDPPK